MVTEIYENEVEETDEEAMMNICAHCGREGVETFPVEDNDPSVGYYSTIFICERCS